MKAFFILDKYVFAFGWLLYTIFVLIWVINFTKYVEPSGYIIFHGIGLSLICLFLMGASFLCLRSPIGKNFYNYGAQIVINILICFLLWPEVYKFLVEMQGNEMLAFNTNKDGIFDISATKFLAEFSDYFWALLVNILLLSLFYKLTSIYRQNKIYKYISVFVSLTLLVGLPINSYLYLSKI